MTVPLQPLTIQAPSFFGLNKQESASNLDPNWATELVNAVFDDSGRISSRKGWNKLTAGGNELAGSANVQTIFEYQKDKDTKKFIASAEVSGAHEIYELTSTTTSKDTFTDRSGSLTFSGSDWKWQNFNGNVVGFQQGERPIYWNGTGDFALIQTQHADWQASTSYAVGDTVKATSGAHQDVYFVATAAGSSDASEPTWNTSDGAETTDSSVTWEAVVIPKGDDVVAAWGRLWALKENKTELRYSALLDESKWDDTNGGGDIDLKAVLVYGGDIATAVAGFNNLLVIFNQQAIVIYQNPDDPTNLAISDMINGIGCIARDTVQVIGPDILFLDSSGIRSLQRTIIQDNLPEQDISKHVRDFLMSFMDSTSKSVYSPDEGMYLIWNSPFVFYFDVKNRLQDGTPRAARWDGIDPQSAVYASDGEIYFGFDGQVGKYDTNTDNTSPYTLTYKSSWIDFGTTLLKFPKKFKGTFIGGGGYIVTFLWAFDFATTENSANAQAIPSLSDAEWGEAEWGEDEWGGNNTGVTQRSVQMSKNGQHILFGFKVPIDGNPFSIQKVDLFVKAGRISR